MFMFFHGLAVSGPHVGQLCRSTTPFDVRVQLKCRLQVLKRVTLRGFDMSFLDGQAVEAMKHVVPLVDLSEEELALGFPATTAAGRARLQHVCASIWTFVRLCSFMLGGH